MDVVDGANLYVGVGEISDLLTTPTAKITWELSHEDEHVICVHMHYTNFYYLVRSDKDVQSAVRARRGEMSDFVDELLGYINVDNGALDEPDALDLVDAVWLTDSMRGRGYGEGFFRLAYQMSKSGIRTSVDLGSMSLATLIRLYQKEQSIRLIYDHKEVPRDSVALVGIDIWWNNLNLCSPSTGKFWFEWNK
jgi:hypothetical protein